MFPPVKRVAFPERLLEIMPTPVIEEFSDSEVDTSPTEDDHKRRRELIEAEDGHSTPVHRRRKRRDWIWRPVEDDVLTSHDFVLIGNTGNDTETPSVRVQADSVNVQHDLENEKDHVATRLPSTPQQEFTN